MTFIWEKDIKVFLIGLNVTHPVSKTLTHLLTLLLYLTMGSIDSIVTLNFGFLLLSKPSLAPKKCSGICTANSIDSIVVLNYGF